MDDFAILGGLFTIALVAATILPAQSEAALVSLLVAGTHSPFLLVAVASAGNVLGAVVNWALGRGVEGFSDRKWFPVSEVALDRATVERSIAAGDSGSGRVLESLRRLSTQLSASQVGITLTTLLVGYLAQPSVATLLRSPLEAVGLSAGLVTSLSVLLALVIVSLNLIVDLTVAFIDPRIRTST